MDISEIRELSKRLESDVLALIKNFEKETGLTVNDIGLHKRTANIKCEEVTIFEEILLSIKL